MSKNSKKVNKSLSNSSKSFSKDIVKETAHLPKENLSKKKKEDIIDITEVNIGLVKPVKDSLNCLEENPKIIKNLLRIALNSDHLKSFKNMLMRMDLKKN